MALREMLAFFGVEVDDKKLDHAGEKMDALAERAQKVGELLAEAFAVHEVAEFIEGQIEMGAQLAHTSEILGLSVGDLQAFQYAAANAGLGADEANTAIRFLNKNMGEAMTGNAEAAKSFAALGVQLRDATGQARPVQDVLAAVADGFVKLPSPAARTAAAMGIFGRSGAQLIPLLNKGSKGIDDLYGEFVKLGGGMDEEFVAKAEETEHQMIRLKTAGKGLESTITSALLPAITAAADWLTSVVVGLRGVTEHSYIVETALWTLAAVSGVLVGIWAIANIEIFLVIAALALLILAVDDVYTFFQGGDSLIGRFFDKLGGAGSQQQIRDFFKDVGKDLGDIKDVVANELMPALGELWTAIQSPDGKKATVDLKSILSDTAVIVHDIASAMETVAHWAAVAAKAIALAKDGPELTRQAGKAAGLSDRETSAAVATGSALDDVAQFLNVHLQASLAGYIGGPIASSIAGTVIEQHQGDRTVHVTVQGGDSPRETGISVADGVRLALDDELSTAHRTLATGGGH
jgi:TP901 family phage tail tape measure protein